MKPEINDRKKDVKKTNTWRLSHTSLRNGSVPDETDEETRERFRQVTTKIQLH